MPESPITRQELLDALAKMGEPPRYRDIESNENGPIQKPVDRYNQLPETTRDWLEGLRPDDTKELDDVRRWFRNTRIITTFGKWVVVALVTTLVATGQVGKIVFEAISIFKGAP